MGLNSPEEILSRSDNELTFSEHYSDFLLSDSEVFESGNPKINYEGTITVESLPGKGTKINIYLPTGLEENGFSS